MLCDSMYERWGWQSVQAGSEFTLRPHPGKRPKESRVMNASNYVPKKVSELEIVNFDDFHSISTRSLWERLQPELIGQLAAQELE